jgi:hypothetical protein
MPPSIVKSNVLAFAEVKTPAARAPASMLNVKTTQRSAPTPTKNPLATKLEFPESPSSISVYEQAVLGGRHKGWAKEMAKRSTTELQRGIRSLEKEIKLHEAKINNPRQHTNNWDSMRPEQQQSLLKRWPQDIARQQEQKNILEVILRERNVK